MVRCKSRTNRSGRHRAACSAGAGSHYYKRRGGSTGIRSRCFKWLPIEAPGTRGGRGGRGGVPVPVAPLATLTRALLCIMNQAQAPSACWDFAAHAADCGLNIHHKRFLPELSTVICRPLSEFQILNIVGSWLGTWASWGGCLDLFMRIFHAG